jgi:hypothetical protein
MSSNAQKLLAVLQDYAPTGSAQARCGELIGEMFKDGLTTREIDATLAGYISDGIRHGNWPWTRHGNWPWREQPKKPEVEVEMLFEVRKVTEWKDDSVYKTENTGETRWLTQEEVKANYPRETNLIFSAMPTTYTGPIVRQRKA